MRDHDSDRAREAEQEAAEDTFYEEMYNRVGPEWARDHDPELFEEHYEEAIRQFTSERLQSYYLAHPNLAIPARQMLVYAHLLRPKFPQAALVFAVTAIELTLKTILLKPIIFGLVHTEDLASFIADMTIKQSGLDRFHTLLTEILAHLGNVELQKVKRLDSTKTLWEEFVEVQKSRNALVHGGQKCNDGLADLAISIAVTLLNEIFPQVLAKLGLTLDSSMTVCKLSST